MTNGLSKLPWASRGHRAPASWAEWRIEAGSRNGHVREAAVQALASSGDGDAIPVLLARANDWVPEVRTAASAALEVFLLDEHLGAWTRALGDVAALRRAARADHAPLLQKIEGFLATPARVSALKGGRTDMSRSAVRLLLRLELRAADDEATRYGVLRDAVLSSDLAVACYAASMISSIEPPARRIGLAGAACRSIYAAVRLVALRIALQTPSSATQSLVRRLAFDFSANIRAIALRALADERDALIEEARRRLQNDRRSRERAVALDVLCALGAPDALALCEAAAADAAMAVRCMGYARRFAAASAEECDGLILHVLRDHSPRVRRLAVSQVSHGASAPSSAALLAVYDANHDAADSLVSVASHLSPWSRFDFLLSLLKRSANDSVLTVRLHRDLQRWNVDRFRCFVDPASEQTRAVSERWTEVRDRLPVHLRDALGFHLRTFGIVGAP